jgi:hypothetical protein
VVTLTVPPLGPQDPIGAAAGRKAQAPARVHDEQAQVLVVGGKVIDRLTSQVEHEQGGDGRAATLGVLEDLRQGGDLVALFVRGPRAQEPAFVPTSDVELSQKAQRKIEHVAARGTVARRSRARVIARRGGFEFDKEAGQSFFDRIARAAGSRDAIADPDPDRSQLYVLLAGAPILVEFASLIVGPIGHGLPAFQEVLARL